MTDRCQLITLGDWLGYAVLIGLLSGCVSEPAYVVSSDLPIPDFAGHWEIDYARSDSVQTQLNASFREVQRELRRRREAAERGATYQGAPLGTLDRLVALAKMAELVTESELLEVFQDRQLVRIERENSFALSCSLEGDQSVPSQLGAERCWWDGRQLNFSVLLPDGLTIKHRFARSDDGLSIAQRTALSAPGVSREVEVVRIFSRFDPAARGFRCTQTLSRGRVCTTEPDES
jgi:hypothetical protein